MEIATSSDPSRLRPLRRFLIVLFFIVPSQGQAQDRSTFAEVPTPLRARLVERMNLLFEYSRTQQWGNLYDLLYEPTESKKNYIEHNTRFSQQFGNDPILEFTPQSATLLYPNSGWWYIRGCAKQLKDGSYMQLEADVQARLKSDEWYFSSFGISIPIDGEPKPCSLTRQLTQREGQTATQSSIRRRPVGEARGICVIPIL
jgi:hypothetical protein